MLQAGAGVPEDSPSSDSHTRLVTVFFGANDASLLEENPKQHVPLDEYRKNLQEIIEILRQRVPSAQILVVCETKILALQKERFKDKATGRPERTNEMAGKYAAAAEETAKELGFPSLNLWRLMQ
ncbi:Iah1, partial [Symbiodinium necroappetens]